MFLMAWSDRDCVDAAVMDETVNTLGLFGPVVFMLFSTLSAG